MIYDLMSELHDTLQYVHPANRTYVEEYLNGRSFIWVEGLLRSFRLAPDELRRDADLLAVSETIRKSQEEKFLGNLSSLSFVAKSEDDVLNIVANAGRAETVCCLISYMKIVKLTKHTSSGSYLSFISY